MTCNLHAAFVCLIAMCVTAGAVAYLDTKSLTAKTESAREMAAIGLVVVFWVWFAFAIAFCSYAVFPLLLTASICT